MYFGGLYRKGLSKTSEVFQTMPEETAEVG